MASSKMVNLAGVDPLIGSTLDDRFYWYCQCIACLSNTSFDEVSAALKGLVDDNVDAVFSKLNPLVTTRVSQNTRYVLNRDILSGIIYPVLVKVIGITVFGNDISPNQWFFPQVEFQKLFVQVKLGLGQGLDQLSGRLIPLVQEYGSDEAIHVLCSELRSEAKCPD